MRAHKITAALVGLVLVATSTAALAEEPGDATPARETLTRADRYTTVSVGDGSLQGQQDAPVDDIASVELRGDAAELQALVEASGGDVLGADDRTVHAEIPQADLAGVVDSPAVESFGPLPRLRAAATSEGVALTNADDWLTAGTDGTGVDVAIVDVGFGDWASRLGTELPATVQTSFGACTNPLGDPHGTAVAEVVHDMAPGATLHLLCVDSTLDLGFNTPVMQYLDTHDIEVVNASIGTVLNSRGDGQSEVDRAISESRQRGHLWVVAAGNAGDGHLRAAKGTTIQRTFLTDVPNAYSDLVDLNPGGGIDKFVTIRVPAFGIASVEARWDAFPTTRTDYDLLLFTSAALSDAGFVNGSLEDQFNGNLPPVEAFAFQNTTSSARNFYLAVSAYDENNVPKKTAAQIDVFVSGAISVEHATPTGSVSEPGTSAGALTVGASCRGSASIEPFSGQGPTIDGRVKPDLVGPDGTSSSVYGAAGSCSGSSGFFGTSAGSPHVAGAAALVLEADPTLGPTDVQSILERRATPSGAAGKDNVWGSGRLHLGAADAPGAPTGDLFTGLSPGRRLLDTRTTSSPIGSSATRSVPVAGTNGVPADATAVVLSVVAVKPSANGYLTTFPAGASRPVASSLNFTKGAVVSNSVTVGLGAGGAINLFNYSGSTHVVVDITGWYGPTATTGLQGLAPIRAVDTRAGNQTRIPVPGGNIGGSEVLNVQLAGNASIPEVPATATAVVVNATVTQPTITGHLTIWPDGVAKPLLSNVNFDRGASVANLVVAKVGTGGRINVAANGGKAHVVLDIVGYYDTTAPGRFVALPTVNRVIDTRTGNGGPVRKIQAGFTRQAGISELHGVPGDATAVVLNVTAVNPTAATGHLRVWGTGPLPPASSLNFTRNATVANAAVVGLGASPTLIPGWFGTYNGSTGTVDVIADVSGYFVGAA